MVDGAPVRALRVTNRLIWRCSGLRVRGLGDWACSTSFTRRCIEDGSPQQQGPGAASGISSGVKRLQSAAYL
jgi:hypothetical protein